MDGLKLVANRLLRFARNDSSHLIEMRFGAVDLLAMTVLFRLKCAPARWIYSQ
jgi:hypothetical protein